jgi:hypothetical protein
MDAKDGAHDAGAGAPGDDLARLLEAVAAGRTTPRQARAELDAHAITYVDDFACLDIGRRARTGVPEVVYAAGKTGEQLVAVARVLVERCGAVLCSATSVAQAELLGAAGLGEVRYDERSGVVAVHGPDYVAPPRAGAIGILAAGTSDVARAEEAAAVAREMGVHVLSAYDVGVAGLHRLGDPLRRMIAAGVAAYVVAAGMEGALPSVVAGLVDAPVIGLPVSVGYGLGGRGEAALLGMLQSCVPGLVVVNIDNGVGAGATAALIARRCSAGPAATDR